MTDQLTAQEVFDKAYIGVMRQGNKCMLNESCVYRGANGTACAAGMLITDEEAAFLEAQTDTTWNSFIDIDDYSLEPERLRGHGNLIGALQRAHDECRDDADSAWFRDEFHRTASEVAQDYELTVPRWRQELTTN